MLAFAARVYLVAADGGGLGVEIAFWEPPHVVDCVYGAVWEPVRMYFGMFTCAPPAE